MLQFKLFMSRFSLWIGVFVLVCNLFPEEKTEFDSGYLKSLKWREIGPACTGGRIADIEAADENPHIIFVGAATGGIFKSKNNGVTWRPVFDAPGRSLSIGDIDIAPSDSKIIWVGTGESNSESEPASVGSGVYKSIDCGETWKYMGLKETYHIGRVAVHPKNTDIVFVAALGHTWGPNPERGLYRTRDGGISWQKVLYINPDVGVVDVAIEPDGHVLYAATYQRRRHAWGHLRGGPESGLYRSMDGGNTWEKLRKGLPEGKTGRIGIDISRSHPHIVYAVIENKDGGIFRSEDRGLSWTRVNKMNASTYWYGRVHIDPCNPDKIWVMGTNLSVSIDGGKTVTHEGSAKDIHVDHHTIWIDHKNTKHVILGNDGGLYISYDGGKSWGFIDNLPITQCYAIAVDYRNPYFVYCGLQDNGRWGIPSRTYSGLGILNSDAVYVGWGDGFCVAIDPEDHSVVFSESQHGVLTYWNLNTMEQKSIKPAPEDPEEKYRFNWRTPLVLSPHDSNILYFGGNKLFMTKDRGHKWEEISPDLTKNLDTKKRTIMGLKFTPKTFSTITAISESPVKAGLIYVGTDDGNVKFTSNHGNTWQNLTQRFEIPAERWVCDVQASRHSAGRAYAAFSGHMYDDYTPYIFKTEDFGRSWKNITGNMPVKAVVKAVAEHPCNPDLLFAGTHLGLFISIDGGENWVLSGGDLPPVAVNDIIVHRRDNDLILGTYGRGIYILDDIAMLEHLNQSVLSSPVYLFPPKNAVQFHATSRVVTLGEAKFSGQNPEYGALITYYLKDSPKGKNDKQLPVDELKVKIEILDKDENVVCVLDGPAEKGVNRVNWGLCYDTDTGPFVLPEEYTVKLIACDQESVQILKVRMDPRVKASRKELQERLDVGLVLVEIQHVQKLAQKIIKELEDEMKDINKLISQQDGVPVELSSRVKAISDKLSDVKKTFEPDRGSSASGFINQLRRSSTEPTLVQKRTVVSIFNKTNVNIEKLNSLLIQEIPGLQKELNSKGIRTALPKPIKLLKRKD